MVHCKDSVGCPTCCDAFSNYLDQAKIHGIESVFKKCIDRDNYLEL